MVAFISSAQEMKKFLIISVVTGSIDFTALIMV